MEHPENIENRLEIGDLLAIAQRRRLVWIPLFLVIFATSLVLAYTLPSVYQSSSTILIDLQEIPPDIVSTTIGGYVEARLSAVEQRINSSESLASIIKKFSVYPDAQDPTAQAEAIAKMRESILRESSVVEVPGPGAHRRRHCFVHDFFRAQKSPDCTAGDQRAGNALPGRKHAQSG